jgi:hypothetical protein
MTEPPNWPPGPPSEPPNWPPGPPTEPSSWPADRPDASAGWPSQPVPAPGWPAGPAGQGQLAAAGPDSGWPAGAVSVQPPQVPVAGQPLPWAPPPAPSEPWTTPAEVRAACLVGVMLAAAGIVAGVLWKSWTVKTHGYDIGSGVIVPDETEGWIGADAHFAIITGLFGLAAGALGWWHRRARGPVMVAGLVAGALLGSLMADAVGHLLGGGSHTVAPQTNFVDRLPLAVHAHGLLLVQAIAALAVYLAAALFVDRDDLGVNRVAPPTGGPGRPTAGSDRAAGRSADAEDRPERLRRDGDGPGGVQQSDLAAQ